MIMQVALFTYADGSAECIAHADDGKVTRRTAPSFSRLIVRTPQEVRDALKEMKLIKTRTGSRVSGEWYARG